MKMIVDNISEYIPYINDIFVELMKNWLDCNKHLCNRGVFYVVFWFVINRWFPFQLAQVIQSMLQ